MIPDINAIENGEKGIYKSYVPHTKHTCGNYMTNCKSGSCNNSGKTCTIAPTGFTEGKQKMKIEVSRETLSLMICVETKRSKQTSNISNSAHPTNRRRTIKACGIRSCGT